MPRIRSDIFLNLYTTQARLLTFMSRWAMVKMLGEIGWEATAKCFATYVANH